MKYLLNLIVSFLMLLSLVGCNDKRVYTIPIKLDSLQRIIIPLEFNGKVCDFLFDTGCSITNIARSEDIDLTKINYKGKKDSSFGYDSQVIADLYPRGTFKIGEFQTETSFHFTSLTSEKRKLGMKNILGLNFILKYYWFFDFDKNIVKVSRSPIPFTEKETLAFKYDDCKNISLVIDLRFNPETKFKFLFDTGAGKFYGISLYYLDTIHFEKIRIDSTDLTYKRSSDPWVWVSRSLSVNRYKIDYPIFVFDDNLERIKRMRSKGFEGLIPISFVHRYSMLYIDPRQKKILFFGEKEEEKDSLRLYFEDLQSRRKRAHPNK